MIRTRVGYAGGSKANPTYRSLGNHAETIQIDYDPEQISYSELLVQFWDNHSPTIRAHSRQYASLILVHDEEQERLALESKAAYEARTGLSVFTEILALDQFHLAEDYHQKYRLRSNKALAQEFELIYPDPQEWVASTSAARINGYLGGYGDREQLLAELPDLGLPERAAEILMNQVQ